jgi:hypothetical protein
MFASKSSLRIAKFSLAAVLAIITLCRAASLRAQAGAPPFVAPVPPQLYSDKFVFLSNAGVAPDLRDRIDSAGPSQSAPFSQLYAALQNSKRLRLTSSPAEAELVFEFSFTDPATTCGNEKTCPTAIMELAIYDVKTHFRLWTFIEPVDGALLTSNFMKNISQTIATLVAEVITVTTPVQK